MTLLDPETIIRKVISIYEDDYATELAAVQANWASTEDITLDDFRERQIVASPEILPRAWEPPLLQATTGVVQATDAVGQVQQFRDWYAIDIQLFYYFKHPDNRTLSLIVMRHQEATFNLLKKHPTLDYSHRASVLPNSLSMSPSSTATSRNVLVKGLMVRFGFRFLQSGS